MSKGLPLKFSKTASNIAILLLLFISSLLSEDRRSSAPYITGDSFRACCQFIYENKTCPFSPIDVQEGDAVFVKVDLLATFFSTIHPLIPSKYVLITHNGDLSCPGHHSTYLEDEKLIAWFGQNVELISHPKLHPIPIGLENRYSKNGNPKVIEEKRKLASTVPKQHLLYMNFNVRNCKGERLHLFNLFKNAPFCFKSKPKTYAAYLDDLASSCFILSPRGNGLDCHRTWEALYMGAIPIVRKSAMDRVFDDLPVLIIDDWSEITEIFLLKKWKEMSNKNYDLEKLSMDHWAHLLKVLH